MIGEYFKFALLVLCFTTAAVCLHIQQWLGAPLFWCNRRFAEWQVFVKELTAVLVLGLNHWRAPVTAQVSGDASVSGQIRRSNSGSVVVDFPHRMVLIANHHLDTDWISLWWSAYLAGYHGYLIIVLKDSIRKIPILGSGMAFFQWVFLSRRWEADKSRLQDSLTRLADPSNPMWLLIFPEGTNLSTRSLGISKKWADKNGFPYSNRILLPRTRGLHICLESLADAVPWVYDCTIAYEDIPADRDGQDVYNLKTFYMEGQKAPVTHLYWRRFAVKEIPLQDPQAFDHWLYERWAEKDQLLQFFEANGRFPASDGYVREKVELRKSIEILQVFTSLLAVLASWFIVKYVLVGLGAFYASVRAR